MSIRDSYLAAELVEAFEAAATTGTVPRVPTHPVSLTARLAGAVSGPSDRARAVLEPHVTPDPELDAEALRAAQFSEVLAAAADASKALKGISLE